MFKGLSLVVFLAGCLMVPPALGQAQDSKTATGTSTPAPVATPAVKPVDTGRSDAAEARYRAWVDREHAQDAAAFQQGRSKIEDKYKGYVRPKREKKNAKSSPQTPAKEN